jgi:hypothetical protein
MRLVRQRFLYFLGYSCFDGFLGVSKGAGCCAAFLCRFFTSHVMVVLMSKEGKHVQSRAELLLRCVLRLGDLKGV